MTNPPSQTPKGLLDLATETRLQIYSYVFEAIHYRRTAVFHRFGTFEESWPDTCAPVSTSILRVNRQIYREALPVMWETIEFGMKIPICSSDTATFDISNKEAMARLFELDKDMAGGIRRMAIGTTHSPMVTDADIRLASYCVFISEHLPRLRELRIHMDVWNAPGFIHAFSSWVR